MEHGGSAAFHRGAAATAVLGLTGAGLGIVLRSGTSPFRPRPWEGDAPAVLATLLLGLIVVAVVRGLRSSPRPVDERSTLDPRLTWATAAAAGVAIAALLLAPATFDSIAREDGLVEWVSAGAMAWACVAMATATRGQPRWVRAPMWLAAITFFVIAGEEVSWLQRVIGYGTPSALGGNVQGEANLHNMATHKVQMAYYLVACVGLVLVPYVVRWSSDRLDALRPFVPGTIPVALAAAAAPFTYGRSAHLVHHLTFWIVVAVLLSWDRDLRLRRWTSALVAVAVVGQVAVLAGAPDLPRAWAPSEYRETFLALGFAAWAGELRARSRASDASVAAAAFDPTAVDVLLFDLGGVVIDIDFNRCTERWAAAAGLDPTEVTSRFGFDAAYQAHERGQLDAAGYFDSVRRSLDLELDDGQLRDGWNDIYVGSTGIRPLLEAARTSFPVMAFTNTNPTHLAACRARFADELDVFERIFASSDLGLRKPDAEAFAAVAAAIGVPPERILFFDDTPENVRGAGAAGMQAVHVTGPDSVAAVLTSLGVGVAAGPA